MCHHPLLRRSRGKVKNHGVAAVNLCRLFFASAIDAGGFPFITAFLALVFDFLEDLHTPHSTARRCLTAWFPWPFETGNADLFAFHFPAMFFYGHGSRHGFTGRTITAGALSEMMCGPYPRTNQGKQQGCENQQSGSE